MISSDGNQNTKVIHTLDADLLKKLDKIASQNGATVEDVISYILSKTVSRDSDGSLKLGLSFDSSLARKINAAFDIIEDVY